MLAGWDLTSQFSPIIHASYHVRLNANLGFYRRVNRPSGTVMAALDLIVIGFASFVAIVDIGIVALLTAHRH